MHDLAVGLFPFKFGYSAFMRILAANDWFEAAFKELTGGKKCVELERMAVHPDFQRKGVGSHYLKQALNEAKGEVKPHLLD